MNGLRHKVLLFDLGGVLVEFDAHQPGVTPLAQACQQAAAAAAQVAQPLVVQRGQVDQVEKLIDSMFARAMADGEPTRIGIPVSDIFTGVYSVIGILAALAQRADPSRGQCRKVHARWWQHRVQGKPHRGG